ncbi:hypothetical protein P0D71_08035 [Paraburkholderia sp. RL17-383-BIF-A]|uniref:hypothetical protein n=1 Tax=Paraburkholderia sp. RL17-383-BIF-A TaxID=3031631 RepID=UPI0038BA9422
MKIIGLLAVPIALPGCTMASDEMDIRARLILSAEFTVGAVRCAETASSETVGIVYRYLRSGQERRTTKPSLSLRMVRRAERLAPTIFLHYAAALASFTAACREIAARQRRRIKTIEGQNAD